MKRLSKKLSALFLIAAATFSLLIGTSLPRIHTFSTDIIAQIFPVNYQISYRNSNVQQASVPVYFSNDTAIVSAATGKSAVPTSDAVFVCLDNELRAQNNLRSGMLSAFIMLAATCIPIAFAVTAFSCCNAGAAQRHAKYRAYSNGKVPAASVRASKTPEPSAA